MWCGVVKWMVSRSLDSGRSLPLMAWKHLSRCDSCRNFEAFGRSLEDLSEIPRQLRTGDNLQRKILSGLEQKREAVCRQVDKTILMHKWKPALVGASFIFVLLLGIIWMTGPFRDPSTVLGGFKDVDIAPLKKMISDVESPYEEEISELRQSMETIGLNIRTFFDTRFNK